MIKKKNTKLSKYYTSIQKGLLNFFFFDKIGIYCVITYQNVCDFENLLLRNFKNNSSITDKYILNFRFVHKIKIGDLKIFRRT